MKFSWVKKFVEKSEDYSLVKKPLEEKVQKSKEIIKEAYQRFPRNKIALAWTGGKDSTLVLWMTSQVCEESDFPLPKVMFINEGDVFPETLAFVRKWAKKWGVKVDFVQNDDVLEHIEEKENFLAKFLKLGKIEHIMPPEFHGDPVNPEKGCLCFYHFGWDLIQELKISDSRKQEYMLIVRRNMLI